MPFDKKNLVILVYVGDAGFTRLLECDDPLLNDYEVAIDIASGTWERPGKRGEVKTHLIGTAHGQSHKQGAIGVFDRTNIGHLRSLIEEVQKAALR